MATQNPASPASPPPAPVVTPAFKWGDTNMACVATYNILESDDRLDQFDAPFLPFKDAGTVLLSSLPYYGAGLLSPADLHGRARMNAQKFILYVITNYTDRKEKASDSLTRLRDDITALLENKTSKIVDLAEVTDKFFKFSGEA